jgi:hypothetical protein
VQQAHETSCGSPGVSQARRGDDRGRAGSQSGLGRVGGRLSIERLTEQKTIVVNLA